MAKRTKKGTTVTVELSEAEAAQLAISQSMNKIYKRHELALKLAAKYFDPSKMATYDKFWELAHDFMDIE